MLVTDRAGHTPAALAFTYSQYSTYALLAEAEERARAAVAARASEEPATAPPPEAPPMTAPRLRPSQSALLCLE